MGNVWIVGGLLVGLTNVLLTAITAVAYWVRKDVVPVQVSVLLVAHFLVCAGLQFHWVMTPLDTSHGLAYVLAGVLGLMAASGLAYYLSQFSGMQKEALVQRRLMTLVQYHLPVWVLLLDEDLRIHYSAGRALRSTGWNPKDMLGETLHKYIKNPAAIEMVERSLVGVAGTIRHPGTPGTPKAGRMYLTKTIPINSDGHRWVLSVTVDLTNTHALTDDLFRKKLLRLKAGGASE